MSDARFAPVTAVTSQGSEDAMRGSLEYFRARQPLATRYLLGAPLAAAAELGAEGQRQLMHRTGTLLAEALPLGACATLAEIEAQAAGHLADLGLGWPRIIEASQWLEIRHFEAPPLLGGAEGGAALGLIGLLEGLYAAWLHAAGADAVLTVRWSGSAEAPVPHELFHFGHPARLGGGNGA